MDAYSIALALAIVAAAVAIGGALVGRASRVAAASGVGSLILVAVAAASHVAMGHPPGSRSALGVAAFLREHPALCVTAGVAIGALLLIGRRRGTPRSPLA